MNSYQMVLHRPVETARYLQELGLQAESPISGLPCVVHVDNADEFHARALKRAVRSMESSCAIVLPCNRIMVDTSNA
jgi:hypothetical protein